MQDFPYGKAAFGRAAAQGGRSRRRTRSAGRFGSRAKQRRIGSRGNVSALLCGGAFGLTTTARSLAAAARRGICRQDVCGGYQASLRFAHSNRGAQAPLGVGKTTGERQAAVGLRKPQKARGVRSGGASFAENRRRKVAAPHRRRGARTRGTPRRYTNRRRHAASHRTARYRRRANASNGRTPKAPAHGNGDAGTRKFPASA